MQSVAKVKQLHLRSREERHDEDLAGKVLTAAEPVGKDLTAKKLAEKDPDRMEYADQDLAGKQLSGRKPSGRETSGKQSTGKESSIKESSVNESSVKDSAGNVSAVNKYADKKPADKGSANKDSAGKDSASKERKGSTEKETAVEASSGLNLGSKKPAEKDTAAGKSAHNKLTRLELDDEQAQLHKDKNTSKDVESQAAKETHQRIISTSNTDITTETSGYPIKGRQTIHENIIEEQTSRLTGTTSVSAVETGTSFKRPSKMSHKFSSASKPSLEKPGE